MKNIIVYYSRTGVTKKAAEELASITGWDILEMVAKEDYSGAFGYLRAGRDVTIKKIIEMQPLEKELDKYDVVVVGTPVWVWNMSSPLRSFLYNHKREIKKLACFCTMGSNGDIETFEEVEKESSLKLLAKLALTTKEVMQNSFSDKIKEFVKIF